MKNFLIGLVVGIVLATTGTYAVIEQKAKKAATKENAEKVTKAAQNFTDTIKGVFE
jgi:predicted small secreted protein